MNTTSTRCIVPFKGLAIGRHSFEFVLGDVFFAQFEGGIVQKGNILVQLSLNKLNNLLECDITINGEVAVECDRCLDEFYMPASYEGRLMVSLTEQVNDVDEEMEDEADMMYLHPSENELDLTQYCYESICLSLPLKRIHPNDANGNSTCNKEMLDKLKGMLVS